MLDEIVGGGRGNVDLGNDQGCGGFVLVKDGQSSSVLGILNVAGVQPPPNNNNNLANSAKDW